MKKIKVALKKRVTHYQKISTVPNDPLPWKYKDNSTTERILEDMIALAKKYNRPIITTFYVREFVVYPGYTIKSALEKFTNFFYDRSFDGNKE